MLKNRKIISRFIPLLGLVSCVLLSTTSTAGEKGKFKFGEGGASAYTEEDIASIKPCPNKVWPVKKGKKDWGNWLTAILWEANYHNGWDPFRTPANFKLWNRMGVDAITVTADSESICNRNTPLQIHGPEDRILRNQDFGIEWLNSSGKTLIPNAIWMSDKGGCDGCVKSGTKSLKRNPASHTNICYSSPNTFRWTVRKIKGLKNAFKDAATDKNKKFHAYWLKETSRWWPLRTNGKQFVFSCYCPDCEREFRLYLKRHYKTLANVNKRYGKNYDKWETIPLPLADNRHDEPNHFYDFMKFREWMRLETGEKLWKRLGLTNINNDGTFQFAAWYPGVFQGMNVYKSSKINDYVNVDFGEEFGPRSSIAAMVDSVLRDHPEKKALALWGGGPSTYGNKPGLFKRKIAEHFGHVTNLRGAMTLNWDAGLQRLTCYYSTPKFCPWIAKDLAWWNYFGELHANLLKGMKTAKPEIASYFAKPSVMFESVVHRNKEGLYNERGKAWTWNATMFWQSHLPVHILHPEQIEEGDLKNYKVLYCLYGPRNTKDTLKKIEAFYDKGGYVYGSYDALTWTISKEDLSVFEKVFRCTFNPDSELDKPRIIRFKSNFNKPIGHYKITASHPALPPVGTVLPVTTAIRTVTPLSGGKVYAMYKGKPCIVGTEKTLYIGTDITADLSMTAPKCYKAISEPWQLRYPSIPREQFAKLLKVFSGFAEYAGVKPPVDVFQAGQKAWNINTGTLVKKDGSSIYILSNNEEISGTYDIKFANLPKSAVVADLVSQQTLKPNRNGEFTLTIPDNGLAIILAAEKDIVAHALKQQQIVERCVENVWGDIELSRHFFVQAEVGKEFDGLGYPRNWHGKYPYDMKLLPNATIVLPDQPTKADEELALNIQKLIRDCPLYLGKRWDKLAKKNKNLPKTLGAILPIKKASQITENDLKTKNLLIIGNCNENPIISKLAYDKALKPKIQNKLFTSVMPNSNDLGGNQFIIGGNNDLRKNAFKQFRHWFYTWFDGYWQPLPPDIIAQTAIQTYKKNGWKVIDSAPELITVEKDGKQQKCIIYCNTFCDPVSAVEKYLENYQKYPTVVVYDNVSSKQYFYRQLKKSGKVTLSGKPIKPKLLRSDRVGIDPKK